MSKIWLKRVLVFLISLTVILGWTTPTLAFTEEQQLIMQSWRIVNQSYLDETFNNQNWWLLRENYLKKPLGNTEQAYQSIEQMLATLNDPFTRLLRPEQYHSLQVTTSGELSGVGLQININPDTSLLEVIAPLAGSPAEKAGIKPKDRILEIDGVSTRELTLDEAAAKMRGKVGTKVSLTVESEQESSHRVELIRDKIALNPVSSRLDGSIGYIRLNQFSANATQEVAHAISNLEKQGATSYIFDLRNNPGGLLQSGIEIARLWLNEGTIVYTVNRQGISESFDATNSALTNDPLIVLVNKGTASASEILAGALKENNRAILVGEQTFGKGLIQSLFELPNGAGLAVTVAKYETPLHHDIHKLGITPDSLVAETPITWDELATKQDQQYQTALQLLKGDSTIAQVHP